jgi:hypothetical protein
MIKYARRCDATGRGMNEGYVFGDGELCFSDSEHLIDYLRGLDWEDANGKRSKDIEDDAELMNYFYREEMYYYTEWDMYDIDDEWYDAEGNEYNK